MTSPGGSNRHVLAAEPRSTSLNDRGVFVLLLGGRTIGSESFQISSTTGRVEARAEIRLQVEREGKRVNFSTSPELVMDSSLRPKTYTWSQKGLQAAHVEIDFRTSPAQGRYRTVTGEEERRDFQLTNDLIILDDNVIHHYQLLAERYSLTSGGRQTFQAFIPQQALPGTLTVEDAGAESAEAAGRTQALRHLVVTTELAQIDLWVDEQHRLERVAVPAAQLEAVRKK